MSKRKSIADDLRRAIKAAEKRGMSRYAIAKAAKMQQSQIGRIASGETVPTLDTAEQVAKAIGYRLILAK